MKEAIALKNEYLADVQCKMSVPERWIRSTGESYRNLRLKFLSCRLVEAAQALYLNEQIFPRVMGSYE